MRALLSRRPEVVLAGVTVLWGSTFIVTKDLLREVSPLPYISLRFVLAAAIMLVLFPATVRAPRRTLIDGLALGLGQGGGLLLQVLGQVDTTASKSAFITSLSVPLTPFVAYALHREIPRRAQIAGLLLASTGLALLTWPAGDAPWNRGDLLALGCAFLYSWVIVETSYRSRRSDVFQLATAQTASAAGLFLVALGLAHAGLALTPAGARPALLALEARSLHIGMRSAVEIAYMVVFCTVLTFLAQTWAMSRMSATLAAVVFALEPLIATGLAIAVEGSSEWPGTRGAIGGVLILGGLVASEIRWPEVVRKT